MYSNWDLCCPCTYLQYCPCSLVLQVVNPVYSVMGLALGRSTSGRSWSRFSHRLKNGCYCNPKHLFFHCSSSLLRCHPMNAVWHIKILQWTPPTNIVRCRCMIHEALFCQHVDMLVLSCLLLTTWTFINFSNIALLQCLFWRLEIFLYLRCQNQCDFVSHCAVGTGIDNVFNRNHWHP